MSEMTHGPDLFAKVGPLPAWAWGLIAVGGYTLWSHMHSSKATATEPDTTDPTTQDIGSDAGAGLGGSFLTPDNPSDAGYNYGDVLAGDYSGTVVPSSTANGSSQFQSNQAWGVYAIEFMVQQGYSASTVTNAITHYLAGSALTAAEMQVVSAAVSLIGPPPLPLPLNAVSTPTPTATGPLAAPVLHGSSVNHRATFTWTRVPGAQWYVVRVKGIASRVKFTGTTWNSTQQTVGHKYGPVTVQAMATGRSSAQSNAVTVVIK